MTIDYQKNNKYHMGNGVILMDANNIYIEDDVIIGRGTTIYPNCYIHSGTQIGENCLLLPNSRIEKSKIGNDVKIESSVLLVCEIGDGSTVGPFAYIRPGSIIGQKCRIGDFVEIKNSVIGDGTKASHLTYVGDSDLGKNINLGCGVVFVNYDGMKKQRSIIKDNAFIGCNTNIIAPVTVGEEAYVAAGTTITEDVPKGALYIGRARGVIKNGWVEKRKLKYKK